MCHPVICFTWGIKKKRVIGHNLPTNRWETTRSLTGLYVGKNQLFMTPDEFLLTCYNHTWSTLFKPETLLVLRIDVMVNSTTCSLRLVYHQIKQPVKPPNRTSSPSSCISGTACLIVVKIPCLLRQQTGMAFCSPLTRVWRRSLGGTGGESMNSAGYSLIE